MAGVQRAVPCMLPLIQTAFPISTLVPVLLVQGRDACSWFDSRFPIIPPTAVLSSRLEAGNIIRIVSDDAPEALGVCGTVQGISGWQGRLICVDIQLVFSSAPEFDRTLTLLAESFHLSHNLYRHFETLRQQFGYPLELHCGWGVFLFVFQW